LEIITVKLRKSERERGRSRTRKRDCMLRAMTRPLRLEFLDTLYHITSRWARSAHKGRKMPLIAA